MINRGVVLSLLILAIIVGAMAGYVFLKKQEQTAGVQPQPAEPAERTVFIEDSVVITQTYENGVHTVTGSLQTPTPCYELSHEVQIAESYPEQVSINLLLTETADSCVQVITEKPFSVSYEAAAEASLQLRVNGKSVSLETNQ